MRPSRPRGGADAVPGLSRPGHRPVARHRRQDTLTTQERSAPLRTSGVGRRGTRPRRARSALTGQFIGRVLRDTWQRAAVKRDDLQAQRLQGVPATQRSGSQMSDSMPRRSIRLRSPGEGPRQARPTTPGDDHAEVPAAQAPPRRPGAAPSVPPRMDQWAPEEVEAHMTVGAHARQGLTSAPHSIQRSTRETSKPSIG
jgi:hypothetical protein